MSSDPQTPDAPHTPEPTPEPTPTAPLPRVDTPSPSPGTVAVPAKYPEEPEGPEV